MTFALAVLAAVVLCAGVVAGRRLVRVRRALARSASEELVHAELADAAATREHERFDAFAALPGAWYWETDADLALRFIAPGFAARLGLVDGAVLGRSLVELVQRGRPHANGAWALSRALAARVDFRHHLIWVDDRGLPVAIELAGTMTYTAAGLVRGYRGTAREVPAARVLPKPPPRPAVPRRPSAAVVRPLW